MIITFYTKDGAFTTDKFKSTEDAKEYLEERIYPIMIQDIQSSGQDRAVIYIPNANVSIHAIKEHGNPQKNGRNLKLVKKDKNENKKVIKYNLEDPELESIMLDDNDPNKQDFNLKMFEKMSATPQQMKQMAQESNRREVQNMVYRYFLRHLSVLYNDPEWQEFRLKYDQEKNGKIF
ncbi:hypothetical protein [Lactobacillus crispatus]|uniref:hypothetical protein n=1 Tax=Lactobacillus crispatus TaxID=47770 RepID=UPI0005E534BA|nr:hypothetical protein [Lactobacillus crispatus]MCT7732176.1 hypothetical protein [Lactobacillus crispatus]MCT7860022.1 hypothetical protein [Lactobacillus crispatus]TDN09444.1 hypothetical protein CEE83_11375 [Lactobacillus crispatus]CPR79799.1 Uncharacterised protein [Chlamydia trachomatis]